MKKKIGWGLIVVLIVIQFIRSDRNSGEAYGPAHIGSTVDVPDQVKEILDRACNDCHSNNTDYPWYAHVQPVAWWLAGHVEEGKEELNFSEFGTYKLKRKLHKLEEIAEQVKEGEMPLKSYTWLHRKARLTEDERQLLISWALSAKASIDSVKAAGN